MLIVVLYLVVTVMLFSMMATPLRLIAPVCYISLIPLTLLYIPL